MNHDYFYPHEKFSSAIYTLATGAEMLQNRIADAYISHLHTLEPEDLPESIQDQFRNLCQRLTRIKDVQRGSVQATMNFMNDADAREVAIQIVEMFQAITRAYYGLDE
ncbi:MAG: hypothetical protein K8J31_04365 [Anaerolineae bacterium]|nr:hypothetical protein [Anaerolineae bacterium]